MKHVLKLARSLDGVAWDRTGKICIESEEAGEEMFSRPDVLREGGLYRMWYSVCGASYRIGYADSRDGIEWTRNDSARACCLRERARIRIRSNTRSFPAMVDGPTRSTTATTTVGPASAWRCWKRIRTLTAGRMPTMHRGLS
jgi:hypothetical protein